MESNTGKATGKRLGKYLLLSELGSGGMATVYRAHDTVLDRDVALKLLHPHLTSHLEATERFQREAKAIARLKHKSILEIFDYSGEHGSDAFLAMELIEGSTLREFINEMKERSIVAEAYALVARQMADALAHAHSMGIIHRDVKPENILLGADGAIKLSDFGVAHFVEMSQMTATGQILGSPSYMSPEHLEHGDLDARADIFSTGSVLYEMAVGHSPFTGKLPHATIRRIIDNEYDDPLNAAPSIGHPLAEIIRRCLRRDPDERYQSADELRDDLDRVLAQVSIDDADAALRAFFENPVEWSDQRQQSIIDHTLAFADTARKNRQFGIAAHHLNRVLAIQPGNERALERISGMNRRYKTRRVAEAGALILLALLLGIGVTSYFALNNDNPSETEPSTFTRTGAAPPDRSEEAIPPRSRVPAPDVLPTETLPAAGTESAEKPGQPRAPARLRKREVIFTPSPLAVSIAIDDQQAYPYGPATRSKKLAVGSHEIKFIPSDTTRFVEGRWKIKIPEGKEPYQFRRRLKWRPARVQVNSNVDAIVTIPARTTGRTNQPFPVNIEKGPEEEVAILISSPGYLPLSKRVRIRAGEVTEVTMKLKTGPEE